MHLLILSRIFPKQTLLQSVHQTCSLCRRAVGLGNVAMSGTIAQGYK
jgi:hypothetical protein